MRTRKKSILIGIAAIAFIQLFPTRSFGWGTTWAGINLEEIVKTARWRLGPFRYNAAFSLVNAGYNSDVYFGSNPKPVPDYTFMVGPDVNLFLPLWKGVVVDLADNLSYVYYLHMQKDRALNNNFRGQLHIALKRWYFQLGGLLVNAQERLSTELNLHLRRNETNLGGSVFWQVSEESAVALRYRSFNYEYLNPEGTTIDFAANLNRKEQLFNLTTYLKQTSKWRFYLDAEYSTYDFKQAVSFLRNTRGIGLYSGVEFAPPPTGDEPIRGISGRINLGYQRYHTSDPQLKDFEGLAGNSNVVVTMSNLLSLRGVFSRSLQFSAFSDLDYYIETTYGLGITQALTRHLKILGDVSFNRHDYASSNSTSSSEARFDHYMNYALGLRFQMVKDLEMTLSTSFSTRRSTLADLPQTDNLIIGLTLIYGFSSAPTSVLTTPFSR